MRRRVPLEEPARKRASCVGADAFVRPASEPSERGGSLVRLGTFSAPALLVASGEPEIYFNFSYSALAAFKTGTSGSASRAG